MAKVVVKELYHKDIMGTITPATVVFVSHDGLTTSLEGKVTYADGRPHEMTMDGVAPWRVKSKTPEDATLTYSVKHADSEMPCSGDLQQQIERLKEVREHTEDLQRLKVGLELLPQGCLGVLTKRILAANKGDRTGMVRFLQDYGTKVYNEASEDLRGVEGVEVRLIPVPEYPVTCENKSITTEDRVTHYIDVTWPRDQPHLFTEVTKRLGGKGAGVLTWTDTEFVMRIKHGTEVCTDGSVMNYTYGTLRVALGALQAEDGSWALTSDGKFHMKREANTVTEEAPSSVASEAVVVVEEPLIDVVPNSIVGFRYNGGRLKNLEAYSHMRPGSELAPVNSPLVIKLPAGTKLTHGVLAEDWYIHAERTGHINNKENRMEYRLLNGLVIQGRFDWTHR